MIKEERREGAKCEVVCANCKKSVPATLKSETISLCEGLEEIKNVLVDVCGLCGSICSIPYKSIEPIQDASARLLESKAVSRYGEISIELKSQVDAKKIRKKESEPDYQHEYPLQATG